MKQAINTRTQEEYDALMEWRRSKGKSDIAPFTWEVYKAETVIIIGGLYLYYGEKSKCINDGYVIIPYTEFAKANIVEVIDYKAKYEEAVKLLEWSMQICSTIQRTKTYGTKFPETASLGGAIDDFLNPRQ